MPEQMPGATVERPKSGQDIAFEQGKLALERDDLETYFNHFAEAMRGLGDEDAGAWQQAAVDLYAAGVRKLGAAEMARLYDEKYDDDPDMRETREWMFGHLKE